MEKSKSLKIRLTASILSMMLVSFSVMAFLSISIGKRALEVTQQLQKPYKSIENSI